MQRAEGSLTLGTREREIDVLHRIDGIGGYAEVLHASAPIRLESEKHASVLTLEGLIRSKRASGRDKDRLHLPELEVIVELRERSGERRPPP